MLILDLDGVLVDFPRAAYKAHNRPYEGNEPTKFNFFEDWGLSAEQFWDPIDVQGYEWWSSLPLYPWAWTLVEQARTSCMGFIVATSPALHPFSTGGKVQAIRGLFGENFRDYAITPRKWALAGPNRVLLDDYEENCEKFEAHGGTSILFPQPWNKNRYLANDEHRIKYVLERLEEANHRASIR